MSEPLNYKYSSVMNNSSMDFEEGIKGNVDYSSIKEVDENDEGKVGINVPSKELMEHNEEKIGIDSKSSENQMLVEDCRVEFVDGKSEEFQYADLPVLAGVVGDEEKFDFCMCNPPFFESMKEAGANPRTACGGTSAEMVYPGGEAAFITKIIEDSTMLKNQIQ
jgi:23S rRNA (adenine1618-N6)-methyltransferase